MTIVVIAQTHDPHRQAEALRGALGLTLRGARVEVVVDGPLLTPLARRVAETLRAFGHVVGAAARRRPGTGRCGRGVDVSRTVLHLVRSAPPPAAVVAARDWVVYLQPMQLAPHGGPPLAPGPIDHDQLVQLIFAADLVVTW